MQPVRRQPPARWFELGPSGLSQSRTTPAVSEDLVYIGASKDQRNLRSEPIMAIRTENSELEWSQRSVTIRAGPTVVGGRAYFATTAGSVGVFDRRAGDRTADGTDGALSPEGSSNGDIISSPVVDGDEVYVGVGGITEARVGSEGTFYRVDRDTGAVEWNVTIDGAPLGSPAVTDEVVYVAETEDFSGQVYALDRASGTVRWRVPTDERIQASTAVSDGAAYVVTDGDDDAGSVYALAERSWNDVPVPPSEPIGDIGDVDVGETATSTLDGSDPTAGERFGDDVRYEATTFDGSAGATVDVELLSTREGAYVYLLGPSGEVLARNGSYVPHEDPGDPAERGTAGEASLYRLDGVSLPSDGTYTVIAASNYPVSEFDSEYELTIGSPSVGDSADGGSGATGSGGGATDDAPATAEVAGSDIVTAVTVGEGSADGPVEASAADLPADVPEPDGDPLAYVDIEAPDPAEGATTVTVDLDSDAVGDADPSSLQLRHYDEGTLTWERLPTTATIDGDTVSVQGTTESFSLFAVTVEAETPTPTPTAKATPSPTPEPTATGTAEPTPRETGGDGSGFGAALALAALLGAGLFARRRQD